MDHSDIDHENMTSAYLKVIRGEKQETLKEVGVKLESDRFVGVGGAVQSVPVKEF